MAKLYLGTSGWSYKDWGKRFYPEGMPAKEQLNYISQTFPTVEINATFYRMPAAKTFANWHDQVPESFRFAVKVSKYISHIKRLDDVEENWHNLLERSSLMRNKLGVYLLQLPPSFHATEENLQRIETFMSYAQKPGIRVAFELRHTSWFDTDSLELFSKYRACLVQAESSRYPHTPERFSPADFAYFRFHGPRQLYASAYTNEELDYWAKEITWHISQGKDVFAYFDNDVNGYALEDAIRLRSKIHIDEV